MQNCIQWKFLSYISFELHMYPDIFENAYFSTSLEKNQRPHKERFQKYLRPHENELILRKWWITSMTMSTQAVGLFFRVWTTNLSRLWCKRFQKDAFYPSTRQKETESSKNPLWRAFSKRSVFGEQKRRLSVDGNPKRIKKDALQKYLDTCGRSIYRLDTWDI